MNFGNSCLPVIDAHYGLVRIESNEGEGSSVILLLPTGIC